MPFWSATVFAVGALLLLLIGIQRAFEQAEAAVTPGRAIGEARWYAFATRPDLHADLRRWLVNVDRSRTADPMQTEIVGPFDLSGIDAADRTWLLTMLRFSCPASAIEIDAEALLSIQPGCTPSLPEFLAEDRQAAHRVWLPTLVGFLLLGFALTRREAAGLGRSGDRWIAELVQGLLVGWAATALLAWIGWSMGLSQLASVIWMGCLAIGAPLLVHRSRAGRGDLRRQAPPPAPTQAWTFLNWLAAGSGILLALVSAWKVLVSEVWSWDHLAVWGFRARKIAHGSLEFLQRPGFDGSNPDYPLGLAFTWLVGTAGRAPTGGDVRLATLIMMVALGALLWTILHPLRTPDRILLIGAMASGPLFWDTEGLGLAELPLVVWVTAAVAIWSRPSARTPSGGWCSLLFLIMVAWTKQEGFVIAIALGVAGSLWMGRHFGARVAAMWSSALVALLLAVRFGTARQTAGGTSFLEGGGWERAMTRLGDPLDILSLLPRTFEHPQWIGWWAAMVLLLVALVGEVGLRRGIGPVGPALIASALAVTCSYVAVYFATYLDPADHIATSWHRIAAPSLWILWLGLAVSLSEVRRGPSRGLSR